MRDVGWDQRACERRPTVGLVYLVGRRELRLDCPTLHLSSLISSMAKCEEGYLCDICGDDVESITESDLYLRFVIGLIDPETLHTTRERHIRCNPTLAQFIVDGDFEPIVVEGPFDKRQLDAKYVRQQEELVTRGWRRLYELERRREPTILDYPLPEVRAKLAAQTNGTRDG